MQGALVRIRRHGRPNPTIFNAGRKFSLYHDALDNGVVNSSFSMTVNLANKAGNVGQSVANDRQVYVASIRATPTAQFGALSLDLPSIFDFGEWDYLWFKGKSSSAGLQWALRFYQSDGASTCGGALNLIPSNTTWTAFRVHLRETSTSFGAATLTATTPLVKTVRFVENNAVFNAGAIDWDEIMLIKCRKSVNPWPYQPPRKIEQIRAYQIPNCHAPLYNVPAFNNIPDPFGTGLWKWYTPFITGDGIATENTEQMCAFFNRKWGFERGYRPVHAGIANRLPNPGVAAKWFDYPDLTLARAQKESVWRQSQRSDWGTAPEDSPNQGFLTEGILQQKRSIFGFQPLSAESLAFSLDLGCAILRAHIDESSNLASGGVSPINTSSTDDIRIRRSIQGYFSGFNNAEDGTSNSEVGDYQSQVMGGTCWQHGSHTGFIISKDWIADAGFRGSVDY